MIDPGAYPILTAVAVLTGFIDAVAGGGGLIMMPALLFAGVPPVHALGTNKLQSMFGTGTALASYARSGLVQLRGNGASVLLVFGGAVAGAAIVQSIAPGILYLIIPLLLMAVALYIVFSPRMTDEDAQQRLGPTGYAPVGGAVGFYDGFFGPAAGAFYTTSLVALRGHGLTRATALAKLFNFASNIASVIIFAAGGHILWLLGLCMAAGAMLGNFIGSRTAMRFGARLIRPLLVAISLGMTARLLWSYFAG